MIQSYSYNRRFKGTRNVDVALGETELSPPIYEMNGDHFHGHTVILSI